MRARAYTICQENTDLGFEKSTLFFEFFIVTMAHGQ